MAKDGTVEPEGPAPGGVDEPVLDEPVLDEPEPELPHPVSAPAGPEPSPEGGPEEPDENEPAGNEAVDEADEPEDADEVPAEPEPLPEPEPEPEPVAAEPPVAEEEPDEGPLQPWWHDPVDDFADEPDEPDEPAPAEPGPRNRLGAAMRPRLSRGQLLAGVLCAVLGFALVVQVQQNRSEGLSSLRQSELVSILDNVSDEAEQLDRDARDLQATRDKLRSGSDASVAAQEAAKSRLDVLAVLAGTVPATGPGIELAISDPDQRVEAAFLLDALQELRAAGAEAVQIGSVRVVAGTYFVDTDEGVQVDQTPLRPPYRFTVIGDSQTLAAALGIPGGVLQSLGQRGAEGKVTQSKRLTISALHSLPAPRYARPVSTPSP